MSLQALHTAATGMVAQDYTIDLISNNISNLNTPGFKKQVGEFQDLMYVDNSRVGHYPSADASSPIPCASQIGLGVKLASVNSIHTQGFLQKSDDPLSVAINGAGYLMIEMPNGDRKYTRSGSLAKNLDGQITTSSGYVLSPGFNIPEDALSVSISYDGQIEVVVSGQTEPTVLGQIELARFVNEDGLKRIGQNLLEETSSSGSPIVSIPGEEGAGFITQYYLESSNVEPVSEMIGLIRAQRTYEMLSKILQSISENWKVVNNASSS